MSLLSGFNDVSVSFSVSNAGDNRTRKLTEPSEGLSKVLMEVVNESAGELRLPSGVDAVVGDSEQTEKVGLDHLPAWT